MCDNQGEGDKRIKSLKTFYGAKDLLVLLSSIDILLIVIFFEFPVLRHIDHQREPPF